MDNKTAFILAELQSHPKGITAKELATATGMRYGIVRDVLASLVAEGTINDARGQRQTYTGRSQSQIDKGKARARLIELLTKHVGPDEAVKLLAVSAPLHKMIECSVDGAYMREVLSAIESWHICCDRVQRESAAVVEVTP